MYYIDTAGVIHWQPLIGTGGSMQTYEPAGPGMLICISGGNYVLRADAEADKEKAVTEVSKDLARQQYDDLQLLGERDEKIRHLETAVTELKEQVATLSTNRDKWERIYKADTEANRKQIADLTAKLNHLVGDECELDKAIRDLCRPYMDVDGDSDGVPPLEDLVASLTTENKRLTDFWERQPLPERVKFTLAYNAKEADHE